jgi:hypothetical protein
MVPFSISFRYQASPSLDIVAFALKPNSLAPLDNLVSAVDCSGHVSF